MRHLLCAALFLLAGCTAPDAPGAGPAAAVDADAATPSEGLAAGESLPAFATARENVTFNATGAYLVGVDEAPAWDASDALALPRSPGSLLIELRCQQTRGLDVDDPGYQLSFTVERGDDRLIQYSAGNSDRCDFRKAYDRTAKGGILDEGRLVEVVLGPDQPLASAQASYDVELAVTWFDADTVPADFSALA